MNFKIFTFVVGLIPFVATSAQANLVKNGSFQTGDFRFWDVEDFYSLDDPTHEVTFVPSTGGYEANFNFGLGIMDQSINTIPGATYQVSFLIHVCPGCDDQGLGGNGTHTTSVPDPLCDIVAEPDCDVLDVSFGDGGIFLSDFGADQTMTFTATAFGHSSLLDFEFFNGPFSISEINITRIPPGSLGHSAQVFDLASVDSPESKVPEPGTWAIFTFGFVNLLMMLSLLRRPRSLRSQGIRTAN